MWSGDVHVPQKIGNIEYVGAPYPIRFGDNFTGRVVVIDRGVQTDWHYDTIRKVHATITQTLELRDYKLRKGDQLKVTLKLSASEMHEWDKRRTAIKTWCSLHGVVLCELGLYTKPKLKLAGVKTASGIVVSHTDAFKRFVKTHCCPR